MGKRSGEKEGKVEDFPLVAIAQILEKPGHHHILAAGRGGYLSGDDDADFAGHGGFSLPCPGRPSLILPMRWLVTGGGGFIGTRLVQEALSLGHEVCALSLLPPVNPEHGKFWRRTDILDAGAVAREVADFQPHVVFHLAARTDCVETITVEEGYRVNTDGVANLLAALRGCSSLKHLVMTSSQFVCGPGYHPRHDEDYHPVTVYGQSKVITEQLTRRADPSCCWTLVRPTNIWGPWHPRYLTEFWRGVI